MTGKRCISASKCPLLLKQSFRFESCTSFRALVAPRACVIVYFESPSMILRILFVCRTLC